MDGALCTNNFDPNPNPNPNPSTLTLTPTRVIEISKSKSRLSARRLMDFGCHERLFRVSGFGWLDLDVGNHDDWCHSIQNGHVGSESTLPANRCNKAHWLIGVCNEPNYCSVISSIAQAASAIVIESFGRRKIITHPEEKTVGGAVFIDWNTVANTEFL